MQSQWSLFILATRWQQRANKYFGTKGETTGSC